MDSAAKPRLLVIVNVFSPDRGGGGAIFSDLCYGLVERGFDVTVRCAYPYYPEWKDKSGNNGLRIQRYEDRGVHVERYGIFIPTNPKSLVQRLIYEASFLFSLLRSLHRGSDFDLVMTYCPLVGAVAFAALNKFLYGKPLWLNVQDLSADAAAASGIAKSRITQNLLRGIQGFLFNQADIWSTISPVMASRLKNIAKRNQTIHCLPNWLNASLATEIAQHRATRTSAPTAPIRLLYAGNIGGKQDLLKFCKLLADTKVSFSFKIHGNGAEAANIESWIAGCKDARFSFGPFLDEMDFAKALQEADLFVITEKTRSGGSFIPCKTIAGIASGVPVLSVCDEDSPLGKEVREHSLGPSFTWNEVSDAPALIQKINEGIVSLAEWQANTRDRAQAYERDKLIAEFDAALRSAISDSKRTAN